MSATQTPFATIEQALDELRRGKMVVVCDYESRENEGDLYDGGASSSRPEAINFMRKEAGWARSAWRSRRSAATSSGST